MSLLPLESDDDDDDDDDDQLREPQPCYRYLNSSSKNDPLTYLHRACTCTCVQATVNNYIGMEVGREEPASDCHHERSAETFRFR